MRTHMLRALVVVCSLCAVVRGQADDEAWLRALENRDYATAFKELLPLAQRGNAVAQRNLGDLYVLGRGVSQDDKEAIKWYRLAAEQGDKFAQSSLGVIYEYGEGDYKEAAKWYRLAADQGIASAQDKLGEWYEFGEGVSQDYKEAAKWYRLAAEQGFAPAQTNLGGLYANGQGVPQDYVQAHLWFNLAGANGDAYGRKRRDDIALKMTQSQIAEAQRLAREWTPKTSR